ncbi:MAG: hypothetical protein R8G34_05865 [Paracoccaceae bacterium]|nr:hypothetical protein [Paracoccaceae bacterium]
MFTDVWKMRLAQAADDKELVDSQIKDMDNQIDALLDRIVDSASPAVIQAYEKRIEKLERQKIRLADQGAQFIPPQGRLEEFIENTLGFLESPYKVYVKGGLALKRTVLKLAFAEPLRYSRENSY